MIQLLRNYHRRTIRREVVCSEIITSQNERENCLRACPSAPFGEIAGGCQESGAILCASAVCLCDKLW